MAEEVKAGTTPAPSSGEPTVLRVPMNGGLDHRAFAKAVGQVEDSSEDPEDGDTEDAETESTEDKKSTKGGDESEESNEEDSKEEESSEEEVAEEGAEDKDETPEKKPSAKFIKAKLADGTDVKIPEDATFFHKVDGEYTEIKLRDAINREVGELTVNQRLSKLANFEHKLKGETEKVMRADAHKKKLLDEVVALATSEQPELAIARLGEFRGMSPGQMYRKLFNTAIGWIEAFKAEGGDMTLMDKRFNEMDVNYLRQKADKERAALNSQSKKQTLFNLAEEARKSENLNEEEFTGAINELVKEEGFSGKSDNECVNLICERALLRKHEVLVDGAIEEFDPSIFVKNKDIRAKLLEYTNPHEWTKAEIKTLLKEFKKDVATAKLTKRAQGQSPANISKQNGAVRQKDSKPTVLKGVAGLREHFGVRG